MAAPPRATAKGKPGPIRAHSASARFRRCIAGELPCSTLARSLEGEIGKLILDLDPQRHELALQLAQVEGRALLDLADLLHLVGEVLAQLGGLIDPFQGSELHVELRETFAVD